MTVLEKNKKDIEKIFLKYDDEIGLLKGRNIPNYHSNLPEGEYHRINESTNFAAGIFYTESEKYYAVANNILRVLCSLQRKDGELRGLWSYFYEESLEEMHAPDWNYADFNAIPMLNILKDHPDKLEDGMYDLLGEACINACYAIIKRDLTIIYTNPSVMDVFVTVVCGELFSKPEFVEYGRNKLDRFYRHIMANKTFDEYNCPGYSLLIAEIFSIMLRHIKDEEIQQKTKELNFIVWEMLGKHFHYKTGEIVGPNFRRYINFLSTGERSSYKKAAGVTNLISENDEEANTLGLMYAPKCPDELLYLFNESHNEDYSRLFTKGSNYPWFNQPNIDSLYMTEDYSIGSFSLMDGWNQRSALSAYFGNREEKYCVRLRILHELYDFSSGAFATIQQKGGAVSVINFHTNHGDTHVDLDPIINSTIKASDLRVRFQIEANCKTAIEKVTFEKTEKGCLLKIAGTNVELGFPYAQISGEKPYLEITTNENELFVDAVLYSGEEKEINLKDLEEICVVATINIDKNQLFVKEIKTEGEYINVSAKINGKIAEIKALRRAEEQIPSTMATKLLLDGERFEKVADC